MKRIWLILPVISLLVAQQNDANKPTNLEIDQIKYNEQNLMKGYVNDDLDLFIKTTRKLLDKDLTHALAMRDWLMYKNIKHTEKFKLNFSLETLVDKAMESLANN